jgi:hypothetical protein
VASLGIEWLRMRLQTKSDQIIRHEARLADLGIYYGIDLYGFKLRKDLYFFPFR